MEGQILKDIHGHYRKGNSVYGECEDCGNPDVEITIHYGNMWFCANCWAKEVAVKESNITEVQQVNTLHAVNLNIIEASRVLDKAIEIRTDSFNAATIATVELEKAIDDDASIVNKPYAKAELQMNRFIQFQEALFKKREETVEIENNLKAIQVRMNVLGASLRSEEREKLKLSDMSYNPAKVKPAKTVRTISTKSTTKKPKISKDDIRKAAAELGVSEYMVHGLIIGRQCTIDEAKVIIKQSLNLARDMQAAEKAKEEAAQLESLKSEIAVDMDEME